MNASGAIYNHTRGGVRCPGTNTAAIDVYTVEPTAEPESTPRLTAAPYWWVEHIPNDTVQRVSPDGQCIETWSFDWSVAYQLEPWEKLGLTKAEYFRRVRLGRAAQADRDSAASRSRQQTGRGEEYSSYGSGSSVHTVSGGLPGLGRRY